MPFLAKTEWIESQWPVHGEHTVEMIKLVLDQLRTVPFKIHLRPLSFGILVTHSDTVGSGDTDEEIRKGEAIVPNREVLIPDIHDLGIYQGPRPVHLNEDHPDRGTDLWRRDSATASET
jgi:hypothetical protein